VNNNERSQEVDRILWICGGRDSRGTEINRLGGKQNRIFLEKFA
jgi:hypothetical protein